MKPSMPFQFRVVRDVGEPLGLFFRVGRNDHKILKQLLSENRVGMLGAVFDPCNCGCQDELRAEFTERKLDAILDPLAMELSTPGGFTHSRQQLPWASLEPQIHTQFDNSFSQNVAFQIAKFVSEHAFTAVLAPTHYLGEGIKDPWSQIDKRLVVLLRQQLDMIGCTDVAIYYPLAISTKNFIDPAQRAGLKAALSGLPIDALWLRTHPFGSESGDTNLRRYIEACRDMHALGIPLISEKTGVLGLALMAFSAVSGMESGVNNEEKFDFGRLKNKRQPSGKFGIAQRVYLPDLGGFLSHEEAKKFFEHRGLRHFTFQRMDEVAKLSRVTPSLRPNEYLDCILRSATDNIGRAFSYELPDSVKKKLDKSRRKQDGWRATLGEMSRDTINTFSAPIERRIHRVRATA